MRVLFRVVVFVVVGLAAAAAAQTSAWSTANQAAAKGPSRHKAGPPPVRQGGDTVLDAVTLSLPVVHETGTTAGYNDDYDEACPYTLSTSPDAVYRLAPPTSVSVDIDMLGSTYDTKIYVYDEGLGLVACNDDFYPDYVSKLENVPLVGGVEYYLVIDGYGGDFGSYVLNISEFEPCELSYITAAQDEREPPLTDGYQDAHNGGCNSPEFGDPFGSITSYIFIGRTGWYYAAGGGSVRDTDWFEVTIPYYGGLEVIGDAEYACYLFELGPHDCGSVAVIQNVTIGPCQEGSLFIPGAAGSTAWLWVGPTTFEAPNRFIGYEFYYVLYTNMGGVTTETRSWSAVKGMFD
ncbi:MAG: hypothetical protein R3D98_03310 [Candidatus Krumholzibacteriia bacterium]